MALTVRTDAPSRHATCYTRAYAITPADGTPVGPYAALYVGTGGNVQVVMQNYDATTLIPVTLKNVPSGTLLEIGIQSIYSTGTTATDMVGLA